MRVATQSVPRLLCGLVWLIHLSACDGATPAQPMATKAPDKPTTSPASTAPMPKATAAAPVLGSWARSAQACNRPELVLDQASARIQTDADGKPVAFIFDGAQYTQDDQGQVTIELGKAHPYGKTTSKTALTFKLISADVIGLYQAKQYVQFQRCANQRP